MDHLEHAREHLDTASERADGETQRQLQSIREGIFEETIGDRTQAEPGPKVDRIVEVDDQLAHLETEVDQPAAANAIDEVRDHLEAYLRNNPDGGYPEER